MHALTYTLSITLLTLVGVAALLGLCGLVMLLVRWIIRLSHQLAAPARPARSPWQFSDCGQPPGGAPAAEQRNGHGGQPHP
jgi:hypothetical protein